jgi:hypothetical protein
LERLKFLEKWEFNLGIQFFSDIFSLFFENSQTGTLNVPVRISSATGAVSSKPGQSRESGTGGKSDLDINISNNNKISLKSNNKTNDVIDIK